MGSGADVVLMDEQRLGRSLNRMSHEIAEKNIANRPVVLFGINERGYTVASALADSLQPLSDHKVHCFQFTSQESGPAFNQYYKAEIDDPFIIVVDDVIFSGQTMFTALKNITEHLDPPEIHTAVLIDRGHRKFPVKAEFYGMELPTKLNEHVAVAVDGRMLKGVNLVNDKRRKGL